MGTLLGIILALLLNVYVAPEAFLAFQAGFPLFIAAGCLFLFMVVFINILIFIPLQTAEGELTPRIIELFRLDKPILFINSSLLLFSFISFLYALNIPFYFNIKPPILYGIWIVLLGFSLDLLFLYIRRSITYFNPFSVIRRFTQEAHKSTVAARDEELCQWIDAQTEIATKTIGRNGTALCQEAIGEMQMIARNFMESCKSIGHIHSDEKNTQDPEIALGRDADEVGYILFYILQRLEFINNLALKKKQEPICNTIIATLSKITLYAAKFDLSLVSYPVHYIGKAALQAQEHDLTEIPIKASMALLEVSRTILAEVDYTYLDLKDPFLSIINSLEEISKAIFKKDKNISLKILMQPFVDLKELFSSEKVAGHQDTSVIIASINRILGEYEALETVMKTMPGLTTAEPTEERV